MKGLDCNTCRGQYEESGREDDVPCDSENGWADCPYASWQCGSPGNDGPDGCGLASENVQAVEFYTRWKRFGEKTWDLVELEDEPALDDLMAKLSIIDEYAPRINAAIQQDHKARKELEQAKKNKKPRRRRQ